MFSKFAREILILALIFFALTVLLLGSLMLVSFYPIVIPFILGAVSLLLYFGPSIRRFIVNGRRQTW